MKFVNKTNNTIYIKSIDRSIPYDDQVREISEDELLRSPLFANLIFMGQIDVVEFGNSRIENNIRKSLEKMSKLRSKLKKVIKSENTISPNDDTEDHNELSNEIVIKGHFIEGGGYAKCNRNLAKELSRRGYNVKIEVSGSAKNELSPKESSILNKMKGHGSKNSIRIDSMIPTFSNISSGKFKILYTTIESTTIPEQFIEACQNYNEIWVTSDFCKEVLEKHDISVPIIVMPNSIDTDLYTIEGNEYQFHPPLNDFVFVSVFGWSYRKGYDVLLKAYLQEFTSEDNVSLLLVSKAQGGPDVIRKEVNKYIKEYCLEKAPHIARCSKSIPESVMPDLYRASDAFVLYSRGEGFCLPCCEASLCGIPVISTNCSGQSMFLNHDNSYLLEPDSYAKVERGTMNVHYWDGQEFPQLRSENCIQEASNLLREVYDNYDEAVRKNEKLRKHIIDNYSISKAIDNIDIRLQQLRDKL